MSVFVKDYHALKWRAGMVINEDDHLAVEEPLEIRLADGGLLSRCARRATMRNWRPAFCSPKAL